MWKQRYKYYMCKDPRYIITAVSTIKPSNVFEKLNATYRIDEIEKDPIFKELYSYYCQDNGNEFIPIAFSDRVPKLKNLPKIESYLEMHWCIGYICPWIVGGNKALLNNYNRTVNTPSYELLLTWLMWHVHHYSDSIHSGINQLLCEECIRAYVRENKNKISQKRFFDLVYNNKVTFMDNNTCFDWIKHLEELNKRDFYEIIINDFE